MHVAIVRGLPTVQLADYVPEGWAMYSLKEIKQK